jgi:trk system potassium uptake protein
VHVVIMGCGRVGSKLAHILEDRGHSVAVIDQDPEAFRRLRAGFKGRKITGVGFDQDVLQAAGIEDAEAFAAVSSGDNSNVIAARVARESFGVERVAARIYDPRRAEVYQRLGIPTVATVTWTIDQVRRRLCPDKGVDDWSDSSGRLTLVDRSLPDAWAGRSLSDLEEPGRLSLVAVTRAGVPRLDGRDLVGQEGDVLHIAVLNDAKRDLDAALYPKTHGHDDRKRDDRRDDEEGGAA